MKKLVFSFIATVFVSVLSVNAQSLPKGFLKLSQLGFGKISSYAGPCVEGPGMCGGGVLDDGIGEFEAAITRVSDSKVTYALSQRFYQENIQYLKNGLYIGVNYSLPQEVTSKLGISGEFVVERGTSIVTEKDGVYYVSLVRVK